MLRKPIVLITGCSVGGLGAALAEEFAARDCVVYASARTLQKLDGLSPVIQRVCLDVLDNESVNTALHAIIEKEGRIDILVNNAGIKTIGAMLEVSLDDLDRVFQTNVVSVVRVIQAVAPHMISSSSGLIINIGSIAGNSATPWFGPYSASKSALHMITDNLDMELRPFGIKVMLLALGVISSNIASNAEAHHDFKPTKSYYDMYRENINARVGLGSDVMSADAFARRTVNAALSPSPSSYLSFGGQASIAKLFDLLPRRWRLDLGWKAYSQAVPKV